MRLPMHQIKEPSVTIFLQERESLGDISKRSGSFGMKLHKIQVILTHFFEIFATICNLFQNLMISLSYNLNSDDLWPWYMTFDCMNIWRFTYHINKPSLVQIGLQLFKWGHFHIFSLSYNLTSDDLWPWYKTFDPVNKWGFPCCIYDLTWANCPPGNSSCGR